MAPLTALVDVVLALGDPLAIRDSSDAGLLSNITIAFAEDDKLVAR